MGDFYEKLHFTMENVKFWAARHQWGLKGTPLRQMWLNKSFGICSSSDVLTLYDAEKLKKHPRTAIGQSTRL